MNKEETGKQLIKKVEEKFKNWNEESNVTLTSSAETSAYYHYHIEVQSGMFYLSDLIALNVLHFSALLDKIKMTILIKKD